MPDRRELYLQELGSKIIAELVYYHPEPVDMLWAMQEYIQQLQQELRTDDEVITTQTELGCILSGIWAIKKSTNTVSAMSKATSFNKHMEFWVLEYFRDDYYMESSWPSPEVGCTSDAGLGQLKVSCALATGRIMILFDVGDNDLHLQCEDGAYSCTELEEARPHFQGFTSLSKTLNCFMITNCYLESPFTCVIGIINATDVRNIQLTNTRGRLLPEHVKGLKSAHRFTIEGADRNITSVPYEALAQLPALINFNLMEGALKLKETEVQLLQLRRLELSAGDLNAIPARAFSNTPSVTTLLLWGNRIHQIDEESFLGLSKLQELSLNKNELKFLPRHLLWPCSELLRLHVCGNKLENLLGGMFNISTKVEEIKINRNRVRLRLENRTFANLPRLKSLYLESSGIESIPEDLLANTPLQTLSLKGNKLVTLPSKVFQYALLTNLNISYNVIQNIPVDVFSNQEKLESLDVSSNSMKRIPSGLFATLASLRELFLGNNRLENLESTSFAGLSSLKHLDLSYNRLTSLQSSSFEVLRSLQVLQLSHNKLQFGPNARRLSTLDVTPSASIFPFSGLTQLTHLQLQHNQVTELSDDWPLMLYLQQLDLSNNWITHLSNMEFLSNATVDLRHNNITSVQPKVCRELHEDCPTFLLDDNPFTCDCTLYNLIKTYQDKNAKSIIQLGEATCFAPADFFGQLLSDIVPDTLTCTYDQCPTNCSCTIYPSPPHFELDCLYLPSTFPSTDLIMEMNLRNAPKSVSHLPSNVKYLNLSSLNLTYVPNVNATLTIDLRHNRLAAAPSHLFHNNCSVLLAHNPFVCLCSDMESVWKLYKYKHLILDYSNVSCTDGTSIRSALDTICAQRDSIISLSFAALCLLIALLTIILYQFKTEIVILLKKYGLWGGGRGPGHFVYDAFVSYAQQDEQFVYEQLVPELEGGRRPLKLCVNTRDWVVGNWIPNQIALSIDQSRRTIVVLSDHFVDSMWGLTEFRIAHELQRVLVLVLSDVSVEKMSAEPALRAYVSVNAYRISQPLVWDRLKYAVLETKNEFVETVNKEDTPGRGRDMELNDCVTVDDVL